MIMENWYKVSEYSEIGHTLTTLETMPFLSDAKCRVWLVMNKDCTEISFAVNLLGCWVKAYQCQHGTVYIKDAAYFAPITDPLIVPSPSWREKAKANVVKK
jgi:hypothetical protein